MIRGGRESETVRKQESSTLSLFLSLPETAIVPVRPAPCFFPFSLPLILTTASLSLIGEYKAEMESHYDILLLCEETLFPSTPSPSMCHCIKSNSMVLFDDDVCSREENDRVLQDYFTREKNYAPVDGYLQHLRLSSDLCAARFSAVRWIVKAGSPLSLQYGTIFAAVNYLDRFISLNFHIKKWEVWMIELVSIACLSIASKVDEVFIPSLDDFQTEELKHTYQPSTIQRMELAILKALDWRLVCITPYSYVDLLIHRLAPPLANSLAIRTTELLIRALLEIKFLNCSASAIAVSALRCSIKELILLESDTYLSIIENLLPVERKVEMDLCCRLMEQIADPQCCPTSPVTVIPMQRTAVMDCYVDIDTCFFCSSDPSRDFNAEKRKREDFEISSPKS